MANPAVPRIDALDRQILVLYRKNTRLPAATIGERVGLSATAVQRRLKKMREDGVILAETARVDPGALGLGLTCIVGIDLEREGPDAIDRFRQRMRGFQAVQQCYHVTGAHDFVLVVQAADIAAYEAFTRTALTTDANVLSFSTQVVLESGPR
ncbi:ArsR family transcriptional regulator [Arenimonas soli]|uniref:ArsR family transcriptional regulator n=1 Tax=Arenimonas soli TaxID=2269504 RepID=A0ABQ1HLV0_9GAMM|nr:Lrp/AsnC family transcriptional regulator [Arenimonas soli]GGA80908.1 ArsR family transcriptional regulator [Arenimonas soli]